MKKNINEFLFYLNKKKKNFDESIDLNIVLLNKKKKYYNFNINLFYSYNEMHKILFLNDKINKILNNVYYGNNFLNDYLKKKVFFFKIFSDENNFFFIKNKISKFNKKYFVVNKNINYEFEINKFFNKTIYININKSNLLNIKFAKTNFTNSMIIKNYDLLINNLKKNILEPNNIFIEKIFISSTMSKSYLLK